MGGWLKHAGSKTRTSIMRIQWTSKANSDLVRLYDFLALVNPGAAARTVRVLAAAPGKLLRNPRVHEQLDEFAPREVRRMFVGNYEMRYEVQGSVIYVLRLWHTREDR